MSSTPGGQITMTMAGSEVLDATEAPAGSTAQQRTLITGNQGITAQVLNSVSVPKVDQPLIAMLLTLTNGSPTTIDLTNVQALAMPIGASRLKNLTGAKVKACCLTTPTANVGKITVAPGASNPYPLFGTGNNVVLGQGRVEIFSFKGIESDLSAVAAGAKTITFSCTNTGDQVYVEIWAGT